MVNAVKKYNKEDSKKRTVIRGIEASPLPWCWCNFGSYASVLKENKLKENYPIAEDTELFARLRKQGYRGIELPIAPVMHARNNSFHKMIKSGFLYGLLLTKIKMKYGQTGFDTKFQKKSKNSMGLLKRELGLIISRFMFLIGVFLGLIIFHLKRE